MSPEAPLAGLDSGNGLFLRHLPSRAVGIDATYMCDAFVRILTIGLIDALDLDILCHGGTPLRCGYVPSLSIHLRCDTEEAASRGVLAPLYRRWQCPSLSAQSIVRGLMLALVQCRHDSDGGDMSNDPRPLLTEVRVIVELADRESRDMTAMECERCDRLLDAAEALARLQKVGNLARAEAA